MRGELNKETGEILAYIYKTVVADDEPIEDPLNQITLTEAQALSPDVEVGSELRFYRDTTPLGRIAAQLAKQVIFQKVREAERDTVYNEYHGRVNEVVNATVKRIEGPDYIFDLSKAEARMPRKEQSKLESFAVGERVRVVITRVEKATKGPGVIVSRAAPELVSNLFQTEVPEIYDNTVVIRAIAREAGERTKIAVLSRDKDVDAVGACVGMKGMRVQSIIRELRGEKIDIIEYHEDAVTFAEKALQPAKVSRVSIVDSRDKHLEVIVDDTQLSLAIGKKGQNVRLAAKLLGWKIDIKSEEEKRQEVEEQMNSLVGNSATSLENIAAELGDPVLEKLTNAGITSVESLADMTPEELEAIPGIDPETIEKISVAVNNYFSRLEAAAPVESADESPVESPVESNDAVSADAVDVEYSSDPLLAAEPELETEGASVNESEESAEAKLDETAEGAAESGEAAEGEAVEGEIEKHPGEQDTDPENK
jgi:N utilization substance protein A